MHTKPSILPKHFQILERKKYMGSSMKKEEVAFPNVEPRKKKKNIRALVVDDDKVNQTIHQRLLKKLGIENEVVSNGKEAVDSCSSGKIFDIILMDMDMPVMNGVEATRKLRELGNRGIIVGASTRSNGEEKTEFMEAGLDDYHEKPLTLEKLNLILHKFNILVH